MDICTNLLILKILAYCQTALRILRFVIPIGLILKLILDFYKATISGKDDASKEILSLSYRRIGAAIIIFLLPTIIDLVVSLIEDAISYNGVNYQSCLVNIENIDYYEELAYWEKELENQLLEEEKRNAYEKLKAEEQQYLSTHQNTNNTDSDGKFMGQTYGNLTEEQLKDIAKICQREQGTAAGAANEASLMANRYELLSRSSKWKNQSFYNYVLKSGWWAPAKNGKYKSTNLKPSVLNEVKKVLVDGRRTLPLYVDEHDWTGDLEKIVNPGGKTYRTRADFKNRSNFLRDQTVIYNKYGAVYTYYVHGHEGGDADPFGYTNSAKKKVDSMNK